MGTVRIVLRTETKDKDGLCLLRLIYSIKGKRQYYKIKTDYKLREKNWDATNQQALYLDKKAAKKELPLVSFEKFPTAKEIEEINNHLTSLRKQIADIEKLFELSNKPYSKEMVIDELEKKRGRVTKEEALPKEVYSYIDQYITKHSATHKKGSLSVYRSLKNHLTDFQKQYPRPVIFENMDYTFFEDFQTFLLTPRKVWVPSKSKKEGANGKLKDVSLNNTTAAKQLSTLKTFINYARKSGAVVSDKYKDFSIKREAPEVISLTSDEFETLFSMDLADNKKLAQVRDVFCFSCVTGLRYSDLQQLSRVHIKNGEIRLNVQKTSTSLMVPLNDYALRILAKYKGMLKPLPVITNAKMNLYLKELCQKAKISTPIEIVTFRGKVRKTAIYPKHELISVHVGRKTFVTLSLEKGMSAEEVMTITGHKDYKSFKRYVNITETRKKVVMAKAWKMENKLKAV